jgi:hypothetical protein
LIDALCDRHVLSPANCFALGVWDIGVQRPRVKPLKFQTETLPIGRVIHFGKKVPAPDAVRAWGKPAFAGSPPTQRAGCGANDLTRLYCQLPRHEGGEPHKPTNEKGGPKAIPMIGRKKPRVARGGSTAGQAARSGWGARIKRAG